MVLQHYSSWAGGIFNVYLNKQMKIDMKKTIVAFAVMALISCGGGNTTTSVPGDSTVVTPVDSTVVKDSVATNVSSEAVAPVAAPAEKK